MTAPHEIEEGIESSFEEETTLLSLAIRQTCLKSKNLVVKSDELDEEYLVDEVLARAEFGDEAFVGGVLA
jgi:hypothetical protein